VRFWDSSALVAALANEPASPQVAPLMRSDPAVVVWWASPVECASALARRHREGRLSARQLQVFLRSVREAGEDWQVVVPGAAIRDAAIRLLLVHRMRAGDGLQLAAALAWADGRPSGRHFVTLDDCLAAAARLEGFTVLPEGLA
jgi:predicted nucleic acid-binding protein